MEHFGICSRLLCITGMDSNIAALQCVHLKSRMQPEHLALDTVPSDTPMTATASAHKFEAHAWTDQPTLQSKHITHLHALCLQLHERQLTCLPTSTPF